MATADELLSTIDTDKTLIINKDLRTITIPSSVKNLGVESDDDVLRLKFSMPRMYGDVDLSDFSIYINYMNAKNTGDVYVVDDKTIADDTITFSWLVGRVALTYKGNVRFIVCMKKYDNDSNVIQEYNTTIASLPVLEGLETGETIVQQYPDIIEMLLSSGTTDHSKLGNRDAADQHPISAITGLEEALTPLTGTTETLTPMQVYDAIKSGKSVVLQHTNSQFGLFTFASFNIFEGEKAVVSTSIVKETGGTYLVGSLVGNANPNGGWKFNITTMAEADDIPVTVNEALAQAKASGEFDGKSAYAYAQDGGYTGTETEFAAKLASNKLPNPYALTFTGAVNETYDGSSAKTIEIPSGGGGGGTNLSLVYENTFENIASINETIDAMNGKENFVFNIEFTPLADSTTAVTITNTTLYNGERRFFIAYYLKSAPYSAAYPKKAIYGSVLKLGEELWERIVLRSDGTALFGNWNSSVIGRDTLFQYLKDDQWTARAAGLAVNFDQTVESVKVQIYAG